MPRRLFLAAAALLSLSIANAQTISPAATGPLVQSSTGGYQGFLQKTPGGPAGAFLGIPYAQPPVGPMRWKAPGPAPTWTGVRPFTSFGPRCMQPTLYDDMYFRDPGQSEDCLTLNTWMPANLKPGSKLPVMLWIYGGGFTTGSTSEPRQDGAHLATKGVIVITFNYRLGVFGFFTHPELAAENPMHAAGDYGPDGRSRRPDLGA